MTVSNQLELGLQQPSTQNIKIRADKLHVHPVAQRAIVKTHLDRIIKNLDLDKIGPIHCVRYKINGRTEYWIVDGQHRIAALMAMGLGEWEVDVILHLAVKNDDGACNLFIGLNTKVAINQYALFHNEVVAEHEPALTVSRIYSEFKLVPRCSAGNGNIRCFQACKRIVSKGGEDLLRSTFGIAISAWGRTEGAVDGHIVEGISRFLEAHQDCDLETFRTKLSKYPGGPTALIGNARGIRQIRGVGSLANCLYEALVGVYNTGRRTGKIEL